MKEENTKEKILIAARQLFAANGFSGTSIGKIAGLAEVNHSLIFHHFKNKQQLWHEVKQHIVQDANKQVTTIPSTKLNFDDFLTQLFNENIKFYRQNQDLIRIMNWQRLENSSQHNIGITHSAEMSKWISAFREYQKKGDIAEKHPPEFIITSILSIISSAALDPNCYIRKIKDQNAYVKFCIELFKKALG